MLKNRIACVTGAGSGIGSAVCVAMARYGADIIAFVHSNSELAQKTIKEVEKIGRRALVFEVDVRNREQVNNAVEEAMKVFGRIDILCNSAGVVLHSILIECDDETWDKTMDINLKGVLLVTQAVAKTMIKNKYGRIVNISSMVGIEGEFANGPYCVSKAGVSMMTQVLAIELAKYGILVNTVSPGYTNTALFRKGMTDIGLLEGKTVEEVIREVSSRVILKRVAEPEEIAEMICFLSSEKNSYSTGIDILVSGGKVMH